MASTGQYRNKGAFLAFAGATQENCDSMNPYKNSTLYNKHKEEAWAEGFMRRTAELDHEAEVQKDENDLITSIVEDAMGELEEVGVFSSAQKLDLEAAFLVLVKRIKEDL